MMHGSRVDDKHRLDRAARDDQAAAQRDRAARQRLARLDAGRLEPRPWQPPPAPPSAVDLIHHFLWWAGRNTGADAVRGAATRPGRSGTAGRPDAGNRETGGREAALAALELLPAARAELDQLETALLFTARGLGLTWAEMAQAVGLNSPQACQQRLDRLLARQDRPTPGDTAPRDRPAPGSAS